MILPAVTGIIFLKNSSTDLAVSTSETPRPMGIKNIFAMLCSNPKKTKAVIGRTIPMTFFIFPSSLTPSHTARQTSMLHNTALSNAVENV